MENLKFGKIMNSDGNHQENEKKKSRLMKIPLNSFAHGRTFELLDKKKKYATAIKCGEWQNVQDSQIDTQNRRKIEKVDETKV